MLRTFLILTTCILPFQLFAQDGANCDSLYIEWSEHHSKFMTIHEELPNIIGGYEKLEEHLSYTDSAKSSGIEGAVIVWLVVTKDGKVKCPRVVKSLGYGLDEVMLQAISKVQFEPVKVDGRTIETGIAIPARFRLESHNRSFLSKIFGWVKNIF